MNLKIPLATNQWMTKLALPLPAYLLLATSSHSPHPAPKLPILPILWLWSTRGSNVTKCWSRNLTQSANLRNLVSEIHSSSGVFKGFWVWNVFPDHHILADFFVSKEKQGWETSLTALYAISGFSTGSEALWHLQVFYVCVHMCMGVHTCVLYMQARGQYQVSSMTSLPYIFEKRSLTEPGAHQLINWWISKPEGLSLPPWCWDYRHVLRFF